jgi:hypothetical protein
MSQIFKTLCDFLEQDEWTFDIIRENEALALGVSLENGEYKCYSVVDHELELIRFYAIAPVKVPKDKLGVVAEFIARANYGMLFGNFELDYEDGEVRFKTASCQEGMKLSHGAAKNLVYLNCSMLDDYFPGLMEVVYGNVSPEAAIAKIENHEEN